jgi:hypothetical protein
MLSRNRMVLAVAIAAVGLPLMAPTATASGDAEVVAAATTSEAADPLVIPSVFDESLAVDIVRVGNELIANPVSADRALALAPEEGEPSSCTFRLRQYTQGTYVQPPFVFVRYGVLERVDVQYSASSTCNFVTDAIRASAALYYDSALVEQ